MRSHHLLCSLRKCVAVGGFLCLSLRFLISSPDMVISLFIPWLVRIVCPGAGMTAQIFARIQDNFVHIPLRPLFILLLTPPLTLLSYLSPHDLFLIYINFLDFSFLLCYTIRKTSDVYVFTQHSETVCFQKRIRIREHVAYDRISLRKSADRFS